MKKVTAYTIGDVNQYSKRELMEIIYQLGINSTRYYDEENPDFENVKKRIDSIIPNEIVIKCHPLILNYTKNIAISKVEFKRKDNDELILRYKEKLNRYMNWLEDEVENREEDEDIYGDDDDEDDDFLSDEEFEEQYFNSLNDNDVEECFCLTGNKYKYKKVDIKFYVNTESNKTNLLRLLVLFLAECVKIEKNEKYFEEYERKKGKLLKEQSMYKNDEFINSLFKK